MWKEAQTRRQETWDPVPTRAPQYHSANAFSYTSMRKVFSTPVIGDKGVSG